MIGVKQARLIRDCPIAVCICIVKTRAPISASGPVTATTRAHSVPATVVEIIGVRQRD